MNTINTPTIKKYTIMVIFLLTVFMGCSEDKNAPTPIPVGEGNGIVNNSAFTTHHAYAWGLGSYSNSTAEDFVLDLSNGVFKDNYYSDETSTLISINIFSPTSDKITAGIYTFSASNAHAAFTFESAYGYINIIDINGDFEGDKYKYAEGGSVTVSYPDGIFKIEYDIDLANGVTLTGSYTGMVGYFKM